MLAPVASKVSSKVAAIVPPERTRYLAEVAAAVRGYHATTEAQVTAARTVGHLLAAKDVLAERGAAVDDLDAALTERFALIDASTRDLLDGWPAQVEALADQR